MTKTTYYLRFLFCLLCLIYLPFATIAQDAAEIHQKIEQLEREIATLERQIARYNAAGSTSTGQSLRQQVIAKQGEIDQLVEQLRQLKSGNKPRNGSNNPNTAANNNSKKDKQRIKQLEQQLNKAQKELQQLEADFAQISKENKQLRNARSASSNDTELEFTAMQKQLETTEAIITNLEQENTQLQKEIQRLSAQVADDRALTNLQAKVQRLQTDNNTLKQQVDNYRRQARQASSTNRTTNNNTNNQEVQRLERRVDYLKRQNDQLSMQLTQSYRNNNNNHRLGFLQLFRGTRATNLTLGYRYNVTPNFNFVSNAVLHQSTRNVGRLLSVPNGPASGHYGFLGVEWLGNCGIWGGNWGFTLNYANNRGAEITNQMAFLQLQGEVTIIPIRLGIKLGVHGGYVWGTYVNQQAVLNDNSFVNSPNFSTFVGGFDVKARFYFSRFIALAFTWGADWALSEYFEANAWDNHFRFGIGLDVMLPIRVH